MNAHVTQEDHVTRVGHVRSPLQEMAVQARAPPGGAEQSSSALRTLVPRRAAASSAPIG